MVQRQYHSRAYHQYFEGYAETEIIDSKGRRRIERVYVGDYYRLAVSDAMWIWRKVIYACLYVLAMFALIYAGLRNTVINFSAQGTYTLIPQMISFVILLFLAIPVFYYVTSVRNMKVSVYREAAEKLKRRSLVCAIALSVTAIFSAIYTVVWIFGLNNYSQEGVQCIIWNVVSTCSAWGIYILQHYSKYEKITHPNVRPEMSSVIRY